MHRTVPGAGLDSPLTLPVPYPMNKEKAGYLISFCLPEIYIISDEAFSLTEIWNHASDSWSFILKFDYNFYHLKHGLELPLFHIIQDLGITCLLVYRVKLAPLYWVTSLSSWLSILEFMVPFWVLTIKYFFLPMYAQNLDWKGS